MGRNRNIYMGKNSTAKLPAVGSIDSDFEILQNIFATSYDALDNKLLTRQPAVFKKTNKQTVNGRFATLYNICNKHNPRLCDVVKKMQRIINDNLDGRIPDFAALNQLTQVAMQYRLNPYFLEVAMMKINNAQNIRQPQRQKVSHPFMNFNIEEMIKPPPRFRKGRR